MAQFKKTAFLVYPESDLHDPSETATIHTDWHTIERDVRLIAQYFNAEFCYLDQVKFGNRPEFEYRIYKSDDMTEPPLYVEHIFELPVATK